MIKPDGRFTFEKEYCPFREIDKDKLNGDPIFWYCTGPKCGLWTETRNGKGCSVRTGAEAMDSISETLLQILGHLKTNK